MKLSHFLLFLSSIVIFTLSSCKKENGSLVESLPYSFGFDDNNDTSFDGWSGLHDFSDDVPAGGGAWSLKLAPGWVPEEGLAEKYLTPDNGNYNLKLSADTKLSVPFNGFIRLVLQHTSGSKEILAEEMFSNTEWENKIINAPAQITDGDQIIIQLSAGRSEIAGWYAWFDNVKLENE